MNEILLPMPEHLKLLNYLSVMILVVHLPYMGMLIGSTSFSLLFRGINRIEPNETAQKFGKDILTILPCHIGVGIILGIVPLIGLMLLYAEWFYGTTFTLFNYFKVITLMVAIGYFFQWLYHRSVNRGSKSIIIEGIGGFGLLILLGAFYIFICTLSLSFSPEHWTLITTPLPLLINWNACARFLLFTMISFAFTGLGLLLFYFRKQSASLSEDYRRFIRYFGAGLTLASVLLIPLVLLWNLITLPDAAFSGKVVTLYVFSLVFLGLVGLKIFRFIADSSEKVHKKPLVYFVLFLLFLLIADHSAKDTANFDHISILIGKGEAARLALEDTRGGAIAVTGDRKLGREVYNLRCVTCHEYANKKVGPPHKEAIAKYKNDLETLKKYIKAPWKISPAYPAMPAQPLNRKELESVVIYMMENLEKENN